MIGTTPVHCMDRQADIGLGHREPLPMTLLDEDLRRLAAELHTAERDSAPIEPLSARHPELTIADAYEVQREGVRLRVADGDRVRGHKVGLTARVMQEQFGVAQPDFGHLLASMFHPEGEQLPAAGHGELLVQQLAQAVDGQSTRHPPSMPAWAGPPGEVGDAPRSRNPNDQTQATEPRITKLGQPNGRWFVQQVWDTLSR